MPSNRRALSQLSTNAKAGGKSTSNNKKKSQGRKGKRKRGRRLLYTRFRSEPEPESGSPPRTPPSSDDDDMPSGIPHGATKLFDAPVANKSRYAPNILSYSSDPPQSASSPRYHDEEPPPQRHRGDSSNRGRPMRQSSSKSNLSSRVKPSATVAPVPNPQTANASSSMRGHSDRRANDGFSNKKKQSRRSKQRGRATSPDNVWGDAPSKQRGNDRNNIYVAKSSNSSWSKLPSSSSDPRLERDDPYLHSVGLPPKSCSKESFTIDTPASSIKRKSSRKEAKKQQSSSISRQAPARSQYRKRKTKSDKKSPPSRAGKSRKQTVLPSAQPPTTSRVPSRPSVTKNESRYDKPKSKNARVEPCRKKADQQAVAPPAPHRRHKQSSATISEKMLGTQKPRGNQSTSLHFASPALSATELSSITSCSNISSLGLTPKGNAQNGQYYSPPRSRYMTNWGYYDGSPQTSESDMNAPVPQRTSSHPTVNVREPPLPSVYQHEIPRRAVSPKSDMPPPAAKFPPPRRMETGPPGHFFAQNGAPPSTYLNHVNSSDYPSTSATEIDESDKMSSHSQHHYVPHNVDLSNEYYFFRSDSEQAKAGHEAPPPPVPLASIPDEYSRITPQQHEAYHQYLSHGGVDSAEHYHQTYHNNPYSAATHPVLDHEAPRYPERHQPPHSQRGPPPLPNNPTGGAPVPPQRPTHAQYSPRSSTATDITLPLIQPSHVDILHVEDDSECCTSDTVVPSELLHLIETENEVPHNSDQFPGAREWTGYEILSVHDSDGDKGDSILQPMRVNTNQRGACMTDKVLIQGADQSFSGLDSLAGSVYYPPSDPRCNPLTSCKSFGPIEPPYKTSGRLSPVSSNSRWLTTLMSGLALAPAVACVNEPERTF